MANKKENFVQNYTTPNTVQKLELSRQLFILSSAIQNLTPDAEPILSFFHKGSIAWEGNKPIRMWTKPTILPVSYMVDVPVGHHLALPTFAGVARSSWEFKNVHRIQVARSIHEEDKWLYEEPASHAQQVMMDAAAMNDALPWFFSMLIKRMFMSDAEIKKIGGAPKVTQDQDNTECCKKDDSDWQNLGTEYAEVWESKDATDGMLSVQSRKTVEQVAGVFDKDTNEYYGAIKYDAQGKPTTPNGKTMSSYKWPKNLLEEVVKKAALCFRTIKETKATKSTVKQLTQKGAQGDDKYYGLAEAVQAWLMKTTTDLSSEDNLGLDFKKEDTQIAFEDPRKGYKDVINLGKCATCNAGCACKVPHRTSGSDYGLFINPETMMRMKKTIGMFEHMEVNNILTQVYGAQWIETRTIKKDEVWIMHRDAFYFATIGGIESDSERSSYSNKQTFWHRMAFTFGFQPFPCQKITLPA